MKRLSKDQKQQRADLVTRLNDAAKAVRAALAAVNAEIAGKLNSGPCQRTRIHTVATGVIDNSPAPSRLVNADALGEELKFYRRRPRLKSVRPGQARHFARTPKVCSGSNSVMEVMSAARPLFHRKRKSIGDLAMSHSCH